MATLYTSSIQRDAALAVFQRQYSNLSTEEKLAMDNNWSSGTPGGQAGYAETELFRYANFLYAEGLTSAPNAWAKWFVFEIAAAVAVQWRPNLVDSLRRSRDDAKQNALTTYTRIASNDDTESDHQTVKSWLGIRRAVMSACLRQNSPVFASPEHVDSALRKSIYKVWNRAEWSWQVFSDETFDLTAAGGKLQTITLTTAARAIRSDRLWVSSANASDQHVMSYVSADEMQSDLAAQLGTGFPEKFRLQRDGRDLKIQLNRTPDKTYTMRGEFVMRCPEIGAYEDGVTGMGDTDYDDALALIPDEFKDVIERLAIGTVLQDCGQPSGFGIYDKSLADLDALVDDDDMGEPLHWDARDRTRSLVNETRLQGGGYAAGGMN